MMSETVTLILALPLFGAAINMLAGWKMHRRMVEAAGCVSVAGSAYFAVRAFYAMDAAETVRLFDWITVPGFSAPAEFRLDALSATMAVMVTCVSTLIHVYSVGYMKDDEGYARYFALLNLFVFSMLVLVLAANLPLMYLGWEGVGLCSYALIGFWYKDTKNADAGRKAFVVTRVGDVAFGVALIWLYYFARTTDIYGINFAAVDMPAWMATTVGLLLLFGAAGKSAQLPLTVWLPDAMAGPTPVSALIHAATMVTAGVYLLIRMFPVINMSETAMSVIAAVGALTAFYAATAALFQRDIKKVLAYSTISQIGYMFMGVGAGAVTGALFHLLSHAFFKALLFMAAGCIIHAMHEEQDMTKMGGLMYRMPLVFWSFLAGALGLCAAPGASGFFSKDEIMSAVFSHHTGLYYALWGLGELTALVTTVYIFRAVYLVFLGTAKTEPKPVSGFMKWTLVPLAFLSLVGGIINAPKSWGGSEALSALMELQGLAGPGQETAWPLMAVAALVPLAGFIGAYYFYIANAPLRESLYARYSELAGFVQTGWGLDGLYHRVFVAPYGKAAEFLWKRVDMGVVDLAMDSSGMAFAKIGGLLRLGVTGRASDYISAVAAGAALLVAYFAFR